MFFINPTVVLTSLAHFEERLLKNDPGGLHDQVRHSRADPEKRIDKAFTISSLFDRPWRRYATTIIRILFATLLACSRHLDSLVRRIEKEQTRKKQREETGERRGGPRPPLSRLPHYLRASNRLQHYQ